MASVTWTSRVLLAGSLVSAVCFAAGFGLGLVHVAGASWASMLANAGVVAMLATPVLGLVTTIAESRGRSQTVSAAIGVVIVLGVAVAVAVLAR